MFVIWWQFWPQMKMIADIESISNKDEFFSNTVDKLKKSVQQQRKQKCLKGAISKGKVFLLSDKNSTHMKGLIKLAMKLSIKDMLSTGNIN